MAGSAEAPTSLLLKLLIGHGTQVNRELELDLAEDHWLLSKEVFLLFELLI